jgi:hypothetical protein
MKRRWTGFLLGILISIGLLAGLALWPLPTDVMPPTPTAPPPVPVIAPETPPAVEPEPVPVEIMQAPPAPAAPGR